MSMNEILSSTTFENLILEIDPDCQVDDNEVDALSTFDEIEIN